MKTNWVNALDFKNCQVLMELEGRMAEYYRALQYYEDIRHGLSLWQSESPYAQHIVKLVAGGGDVLEVGCGEAGILRENREFESWYSGLDFSEELMRANQEQFPNAKFQSLTETYEWPHEDDTYDLVFSVFVLEHVVRPHLFLDEACRVLKKAGRLVILCPDYLGYYRMASQRLGRAEGTGREKLKQGRVLDALITGWDTRIALPRKMKQLKAAEPGAFWINLDPICFCGDTFRSDVDAVFVTDRDAIINHLVGLFDYVSQSDEIQNQCINDKLLFLEFVKK